MKVIHCPPVPFEIHGGEENFKDAWTRIRRTISSPQPRVCTLRSNDFSVSFPRGFRERDHDVIRDGEVRLAFGFPGGISGFWFFVRLSTVLAHRGQWRAVVDYSMPLLHGSRRY